MQKLLSIIVCLSFLFTVCLNDFAYCMQYNDDFYEGKIKGEMVASTRHSAGGHYVGGAITGVLLGLIGTGLGVGIVALTSPSMPPFYEMKQKEKPAATGQVLSRGTRKKQRAKTYSLFYTAV